jgi:hypothetical protein
MIRTSCSPIHFTRSTRRNTSTEWQSNLSQEISQPRELDGEFGRDDLGDQIALWGGVNLIEMTLAGRQRQEFCDAFVQGAVKDHVRDGPTRICGAFVVFRRPFFEDGSGGEVRLKALLGQFAFRGTEPSPLYNDLGRMVTHQPGYPDRQSCAANRLGDRPVQPPACSASSTRRAPAA